VTALIATDPTDLHASCPMTSRPPRSVGPMRPYAECMTNCPPRAHSWMSLATIRSAGASLSGAVSPSVNQRPMNAFRRSNDSSPIASEYALHDQRLRPPRRQPIRQDDHLVTDSRDHGRSAAQHGVDASGRDGSRLHHEHAENTCVTLAGDIGEPGSRMPPAQAP
jgi:hypothetical protein